MAKPSVTLRASKGSALTYSELDQNFTNLKDATVSLTAGSGGTQVTSDLNGNITLVAGTGITLTGNNTAKTVTITGGTSELVNDLTPQLGGNLDVNNFIITSTGNNSITVEPAGTGQILLRKTIKLGDGASQAIITTNGAYSLLIETQDNNNKSNILLNNSTQDIELNLSSGGRIKTSSTGGTPSNTTTPASWLQINVAGTLYYLPLYS